MPTVEFQEKTFTVDEDDFLIDFSDWCPEWVEYAKRGEEIEELTDEHWKCIDLIQEHYKEHGKPPSVRMFARVTGHTLKHIYELFPSGPGRGACKMAGLPKPIGCA